MEVGLSLGDIVLGGEQPSQFSANVYCGQAPWWTKMPLGMEVGLGPGDCIRWGPSSPGKKGLRPTQFWPKMSIVAKRLDG